MPPSADRPPLLLVLAHGVGARELDRARAAAGLGEMPPVPVQLPARPVAALLGELGATDELTGLGVAVDRSCLVLRPAGRDDATAAAELARRATGPADVTLFEARDVLAQARTGGATAAAAAAARLGDLLVELARVLRRGDAPETWIVGLGAAVAVRTTFDLASAWSERVVPVLGDRTALRVSDRAAFVATANYRAREILVHRLAEPPFAAHGAVAPGEHGELRFEAGPSVAFGRAPIAARGPLPHEAGGFVQAPLGDLARRSALAFADVMVRFWSRAALLHADLGDGADIDTGRVGSDVRVADAAPTAAVDERPVAGPLLSI